MVSSERPDHSWSLAIRTRGGVESNSGIAPSEQKVACRISRIRVRDGGRLDAGRGRTRAGACMLHADTAENLTR